MSPQAASQITESAGFTRILYLYAGTDVRYLRVGVPIGVSSPSSQTYCGSFLCSLRLQHHGLEIGEDCLKCKAGG